jgi:BirA family biotin operon repressor/biotin-[acetyl-CoA-carboxylase] ligase
VSTSGAPATGRVLGRSVIALGEVTSTQTELGRLAAAGAPEGTVITAEHQTAGRGRRGRAWWDRPGASLLFSLLLRPRLPAARAPLLSPLAAVALAEVVAALTGAEAAIRWPNDVLLGEAKLAGILAEAAIDGRGQLRHVLLGIGINLDQTEFPPELGQPATSLRLATGTRPARGDLLDELLAALERWYTRLQAGEVEPLRRAWLARARLGGVVRLADGRRGTAAGLDEDGALLIELEGGGRARVVAGEPGEGPHAAAR